MTNSTNYSNQLNSKIYKVWNTTLGIFQRFEIFLL